MFKKGILTLGVIAFTGSMGLAEAPKPTLEAVPEATLEDKQKFGHLYFSILPYLSSEEKNTLINLIKEGMTRWIIAEAKKAKQEEQESQPQKGKR